MSLWHSAPDGLRRTGWRDWLRAGLLAWLAPAVAGLGVLALHGLAGVLPAGAAPELRLALYMGATELLISPGFTWVILLLLVPALVGLAATGRFGWLPGLGCGAVAGALAAALGGSPGAPIGVAHGLVAAALVRLVLRRLRPAAF